MRINVVVYANCQSGPLANILASLSDAINVIKVEPVHLLKTEHLGRVDAQFLKADVIIHQPVGNEYREFGIASLKGRFPNKTYLSFPSLHFGGYFPNQMYLRKPGGGTLRGIVGDYHDERVGRAFLGGSSIPEVLAQLDRGEAHEGAIAIARSIASLQRRESELDVQCVNFIEENIGRHKLFYVMNHPSNHVLVHVALKTLRLLNITPSAEAATEMKAAKGYLSNYEFPVEPAILKALAHDSLIRGKYSIRENGVDSVVSAESFVSGSYGIYENTPKFDQVFEYAVERRRAME